MSSVLIGIKSVSQMTGLPRSRIYTLMNSGQFPTSTKIGRSVRWYVEDIQKWAKQLRAEDEESPAIRIAPIQRASSERITTIIRRYGPWVVADGRFERALRSTSVNQRTAKDPAPPVPMYINQTGILRPNPGIQETDAKLPRGRRSRRAAVSNLAELQEQYEAGATLDMLAEAHGIGKARLLRVLREAGTVIRPPGPRRRTPHRWPTT